MRFDVVLVAFGFSVCVVGVLVAEGRSGGASFREIRTAKKITKPRIATIIRITAILLPLPPPWDITV